MPRRRDALGKPGTLLLALLLPAAGCGRKDDDDAGPGAHTDTGPGDVGHDAGPQDTGGPRDTGPHEPDLGILHELTELTIEGTVRLDFSALAPWVRVVTHCGATTRETDTDDEGRYSITTNVETCNHLVVAFTKETHLPTYRVIGLPPPTSPVTLDVQMTRLRELQCGSGACVVEGDPVSRFPAGPMERGWVTVFNGPQAVDYLGGEFRDTAGNLLWVTGFGYFDLRDGRGAPLESFPPFTECFQVGFDAVGQLVDMDPSTDEVEMSVFHLDPSSGRWEKQEEVGLVKYTDELDENAQPVLANARRSQLGDIRSGQFHKVVWICMPLGGSGWLAWGVPIRPRTCIRFSAYDQCEDPLANVRFSVRGEGFGYKAESWTDRRGQACVEATRSEALGQDYNHNELSGETFSVTAEATRQQDSPVPWLAYDLPREEASCAAPEECISLRHKFNVFLPEGCP